jgi:hypothetical protein
MDVKAYSLHEWYCGIAMPFKFINMLTHIEENHKFHENAKNGCWPQGSIDCTMQVAKFNE